jgi:hypothetical protein
MKYLAFVVVLVSGLVFAADPVKKAEPITISKPKSMAVYDQETGKFKFEKGAEAEEVAELLMKELITLSQKFQALEASCSKKKNGK